MEKTKISAFLRKNKKIFFEKKKSFTLIELLIVIAIIGILASVVLVSLSFSKQRARDVAAMRTAQSVGTALSACAQVTDYEKDPWFYCPLLANGTPGVTPGSMPCDCNEKGFPCCECIPTAIGETLCAGMPETKLAGLPAGWHYSTIVWGTYRPPNPPVANATLQARLEKMTKGPSYYLRISSGTKNIRCEGMGFIEGTEATTYCSKDW